MYRPKHRHWWKPTRPRIDNNGEWVVFHGKQFPRPMHYVIRSQAASNARWDKPVKGYRKRWDKKQRKVGDYDIYRPGRRVR